MIFRKLAAGILALPVIARLYLPTVARRKLATVLGALAAVVLVSAGALLVLVAGSSAKAPTPIEPVPAGLFAPVLADQALDSAVTVSFTAAMDRTSVARALTVMPSTDVKLTWDASGRILTVSPAAAWTPATDYTVTVAATARDRSGHRLGSPARVVFLTRTATTGRFAVTLDSNALLRADATVALTFDHAVDVASARSALSVQPAIAGTLTAPAGGNAASTFTFTPTAPLPGGRDIVFALGPQVVDGEGGAVAPVDSLTVKTVPAPLIVRSRPSGGAKGVAPGAVLSVRFSVPMDRGTTAAALSVERNGSAIAGTLRWSEDDKVVAFDPVRNLPAGATIRLAVTAAARSAEGAALVKPLGISFTVATPAPTRVTVTSTTKPTSPAPKPAPKPAPQPVAPPSGGATAGSAPWYAVETYFMRLMNCTRTGGWITAGGACGSVPSGLSVRPPAPALALDAGISTKVTRPYARYLAVNGLCNHFYDGNPGDRLRRAGYTSYRWGENIGCPYGDPDAGMIAVERFFQNETPSGGHYVNLMNPAYDRAGVGVWVSSGRVRVVIDFYHP